jgi:hypothetical protein
VVSFQQINECNVQNWHAAFCYKNWSSQGCFGKEKARQSKLSLARSCQKQLGGNCDVQHDGGLEGKQLKWGGR